MASVPHSKRGYRVRAIQRPDQLRVAGPVYGDLLDKWPESKRLTAEFEKATVYDRLCESRDVSHFVAYLLSDPVKLFTGSVLVMDGGISVRWPNRQRAASA